MNKCIVSFGKGYNFEAGVNRLKESVNRIVKVPFIGFNEYPENCPTHEDVPFAFKFYCIKECLKQGYDNILWLDSSVIIKNNLDSVFERMATNGYFFVKNWHCVGQFCHDKALKTLNITRNESFTLPCVVGGNFGLNFEFDFCNKFLEQIMEYIHDGITFPGSYTNKNNMASSNNKVCGHRHDQIPMSIVALRLGMNKWDVSPDPWFIHDRKFVKGNTTGTVKDVIMSE